MNDSLKLERHNLIKFEILQLVQHTVGCRLLYHIAILYHICHIDMFTINTTEWKPGYGEWQNEMDL